MLLNASREPKDHRMEEAVHYNTVESLLGEVSLQGATSTLFRRLSQGSRGSKAGDSMKVVKTASSSPRGLSGLIRRRTVMSGSPYRRQILPAEQGSMATSHNKSLHQLYQPAENCRPVSWHPPSRPPLNFLYPSYNELGIEPNGGLETQQLHSLPSIFPAYASPAPAISPMLEPFPRGTLETFDASQESLFNFPRSFEYIPNTSITSAQYQPTTLSQEFTFSSSTDDLMDNSFYPNFGWTYYSTDGLHSSTAPPTPESFVPVQRADTSFGSDALTPFHSLENEESPGEVLVGMGLYDVPDKIPAYDTHVNNYCTLMTHMMGAPSRKLESTGKGLKLEETWNPPSDDDEDGEDSDNEDEDAEGSTTMENEGAPGKTSVPYVTNPSPRANGTLENGRITQMRPPSGWI